MSSHVNPKLRALDIRWVEYQGQPHLYLRDTLELSGRQMLIPEPLALLLALCDGTRDVAGLRAALDMQTGLRLPLAQVESVIAQLDEALFLEGPRFEEASAAALRAYRQAAFRSPALSGAVSPAGRRDLAKALAAYGSARDQPAGDDGQSAEVLGVVTPHIDYQRGGPVYAALWRKAALAARRAEAVVIFGTDHAGGPGRITLTRQSYATPWGVLPTDRSAVDAMADAIGPEHAFAEEVHHIREHSIELASVWLHHARQGEPCAVVPILCGSFYPYTNDGRSAEEETAFQRALDALRQATAGRRVLVVAAGDLAHVGPTFGDARPLDTAAREQLRAADKDLLSVLASGDAAGFLSVLRREQDGRRICGLPPIYMALRLLGASLGEVTGYDQCPADEQGGSVVSVAGVLLRPPAR